MGKSILKIKNNVIDDWISRFDSDEKEKEVVLTELFNRHRYNNNLSEILVKVTVLNSLYSAGLNNNTGKKKVDVVRMSKHILLEPRLDDWLYSNEKINQLKAYDYIATGESEVRGGEYDNCYAFASKYCSWHRPEIFPIMDSIAKKTIGEIIKNGLFIVDEDNIDGKTPNVWDSGFYDYETYTEICLKLLGAVNNNSDKSKMYYLKDIDKFLWKYGKAGSGFSDSELSTLERRDDIHEIQADI